MILDLQSARGSLARDGAFFDPRLSWTIATWYLVQTSTPSGHTYRNVFMRGTTGAYIELASNYDANDVLIEISDGTSFFDTSSYLLTLGERVHVAATHNAVTHVVSLYVNAVLVASMTHDMSGWIFDTSELVLEGTHGDHAVERLRIWQACLTVPEITKERTAGLAARTASLLSDNPLYSVGDVKDYSGNNRTFTSVDADLDFVAGPSLKIPRGSLVFTGTNGGSADHTPQAMRFLAPNGANLGAPATDPMFPPDGTSPVYEGNCAGIATLHGGGYATIMYMSGVPGIGAEGNVFIYRSDFSTAIIGPTGVDDPDSVGYPEIAVYSIARDDAGNFYGLSTDAPRLFRYNSVGLQTGTWLLTGITTPVVVGVNGNGTIAYVNHSSGGSLVDAWDLVGDVSLGTFATAASGYSVAEFNGILVLANGHVLISWWNFSTSDGYITEYDVDGTSVMTYSRPTMVNPGILTPGLSTSSFWVSYYATGVSTDSGCKLVEFEIGTGTALHEFTPDDGMGFGFDGSFCVVIADIGIPGGGLVASGIDPDAGTSLCGATVPLLWCIVTPTTGSAARFSWVDQPINDSDGQKQPKILNVSSLRRALSDWTGRYDVAHGSVTLWDADAAIRAYIASSTIIRATIDFFMADAAAHKADESIQLRVGQYLISDYDLLGDMTVTLSFEARLGGEAADATLQKLTPYRTLGTAAFPNLPVALIGKREPIPYGILSDEADTGNSVTPLGTVNVWYVGKRKLLDDADWYEGLIAGCATWGPIAVFGSNGADRFAITSVTATNPAVVTTAKAHGYANNDAVTISGCDSTPTINGDQIVTVISSTTFAVFGPHSEDLLKITKVTAANPAVITTSKPHGYSTSDAVTITGCNVTPSINGDRVATVISPTTFSVAVNTSGGTAGTTGIVAPTPAIDVVVTATAGTTGIATRTIVIQRLRQDVSAYSTDIVFPDPSIGQWTAKTGETKKYRVFNSRRYTVIYFRVGSGIGEAFADSTVPVLVNMGGIEEVGDGTGRVITSGPRQILHYKNNFVLQNHATDANWYPIPTTGTPAYSVIDASSYNDVDVVTQSRLPPDGYPGAFVIGADLEPTPIGDWLQRMCLAFDVQMGTDRHGRDRLSIEDASRASVRAFTIKQTITGSYAQKKDRSKLANVVSAWTFKSYSLPTSGLTSSPNDLLPGAPAGQADWLTSQLRGDDGTSIAALGGDPVGVREFHYEDWCTRDFSLHVPYSVLGYQLERRKNGPDFHTSSKDLCAFDVDLGDVYTDTHFAGLVATPRRLRCSSVELNPPDPFSKSFAMTLVGHEITALGSPFGVIPAGSLVFSGFGDLPMVFLSEDGVDLGVPASAPKVGTADDESGCGGLLPFSSGGYFANGTNTPDGHLHDAMVYDAAFNFVGYVTDPSRESAATDATGHGYGLSFYNHANGVHASGDYSIFKFDRTGARIAYWDVVGSGFGFPTTAYCLAVNNAGTVAYIASRNELTVYKYDLAGSAEVGSFVTDTAGGKVWDNDLCVLADDSLLVGWDKSTDSTIKRYSSAGSLLNTYVPSGINSIRDSVVRGLTSETFWCSFGDGSDYGTGVAEIRISDGVEVHRFSPSNTGFEWDGPFCLVTSDVLTAVLIAGPPSFTLTVTNGTGGGLIQPGTVVIITAYPPPSGMVFNGWIGETVTSPSAGSTTFVMPARNANVIATYVDDIDTYTLNVINGGVDGNYEESDVVTLTADAPATGYTFSAWVGDVATVADVNDPTTTMNMPAFPATVRATYVAVGGAGSLTVAWDDPTAAEDGVTGYVIDYGTEPGVYLASVDVGYPTPVDDHEQFTLSGLSAGMRYYVVVKAYAGGVSSSYSSAASGVAS